MGLDYVLVHARFTIPPALLLTWIYRPFASRRDVYRIFFLIITAVVYTTPWDSYLIRTHIWSYPENAVLGPTIFGIPVEELFFFVIQTYDVSLFYLLISRATFHPAYLTSPIAEDVKRKTLFLSETSISLIGYTGLCGLGLALLKGSSLIREATVGTYMGLIIIWALPIVLLLWSLTFRFLLRLPISNTLVPILGATLYLWAVDTLALRRGTWVISSGTKYGIHVWEALEIEEALFFLATNVLVVFGQVAFDQAVAILDTFPNLYPQQIECPSPYRALRALLDDPERWDCQRIEGLSEAVARLQAKSRSFYLASATFTGRVRIDLILLYSFCRVADDLIDGAADYNESKEWVLRLRQFLDLAYAASPKSVEVQTSLSAYVKSNFPPPAHHALLQLPVSYLSKEPLYDLLKGFEMDLEFTPIIQGRLPEAWPIQDDRELELYGEYVAGTIGELCLDLVFRYDPQFSADKKAYLKAAARKMGVALQTVNIARDVVIDAALKRVYIPLTWLEAEGLAPEDVLKSPEASKIQVLRSKLLDKAFKLYGESKGAIEDLPVSMRGPMRVAIESYMEIGRVLRQNNHPVKRGKATVPVVRRIVVAWKALHS